MFRWSLAKIIYTHEHPDASVIAQIGYCNAHFVHICCNYVRTQTTKEVKIHLVILLQTNSPINAHNKSGNALLL